MRITRALVALSVGASLLLAGCISEGRPTTRDTDVESGNTRTDHNAPDVRFASGMIQHHAQALAMIDLTVDRDLDPAFMVVVEAMRMAPGPEIESMTDWLTLWGEPIPATVRDHVNAQEGEHDTEGMTTDETGADVLGMMSDDEMSGLEAASDAEFQDMFLAMMIEHHEGAIEIAQTELEDGQFEPAISLAEEIATTQAAEIDTMQALLS